MFATLRGAAWRTSRKGHWFQFSVTSVIASLLMCMVNLHFGLVGQSQDAEDLGLALLDSLGPVPEGSRSGALQSALAHYRNVGAAALCRGEVCQRIEGPRNDHQPCAEGRWSLCVEVNSLQDPNVSLQLELDPKGIYADVGRDLGLLLGAQALGMLVWLLSSRKNREKLRETQRQLRQAATTDPLTGLLNRTAFDDVIEQALNRGPRGGWILYLDLDGFKGINDQHGHPIGDAVIVAIGGRLRNAFKQDGVVARLGGDEFGILVAGQAPRDIDAIVKTLFDTLEAPVAAHRLSLKVGGSVGVARLDTDVGSAAEAQRRADIAMYEAKRRGRHQAAIFDASQDVARQRDYRLRLDLQTALARNELQVAYQPLINADGSLHGLEALARWTHTTLGPIGPDVFIPLAESSGLIGALGQLVLRRACADLAALREQGLAVPHMAVNLSPQQLADAHLTANLLESLAAAGLGPADMELEITESAIMDPNSRAPAQLERLAAEGFALAIDDFGTGYSSLSRLQTMPARTLKLDRTFIRSLDTPHGQLLARTMLELGRQLDLTCVAEGVETQDQADWLLAHDCDVLQGYLFGKPMPMEALTLWLAARPVPAEAASQ